MRAYVFSWNVRERVASAMSSDGYAQLFYLSLILIALIGWAFAEYRGRMGFALRSALAWGMIFLGVVAGYGLWTDVRADLQGSASVAADGRIAVTRSGDGHFYLDLDVNGTPVRFLADTGATSVVLTRGDAARLGIDPDALDYSEVALTANGSVATAPIRLPEVVLGPYLDQNLRAFVNGGELDISLLGMDYLSAFHVELSGDRMTLWRGQ
jgi:aspartyl protease family protein